MRSLDIPRSSSDSGKRSLDIPCPSLDNDERSLDTCTENSDTLLVKTDI